MRQHTTCGQALGHAESVATGGSKHEGLAGFKRGNGGADIGNPGAPGGGDVSRSSTGRQWQGRIPPPGEPGRDIELRPDRSQAAVFENDPTALDQRLQRLLKQAAGRTDAVDAQAGAAPGGEFLARCRHAAGDRPVEQQPPQVFMQQFQPQQAIIKGTARHRAPLGRRQRRLSSKPLGFGAQGVEMRNQAHRSIRVLTDEQPRHRRPFEDDGVDTHAAFGEGSADVEHAARVHPRKPRKARRVAGTASAGATGAASGSLNSAVIAASAVSRACS